jgi:hypothetical protein
MPEQLPGVVARVDVVAGLGQRVDVVVYLRVAAVELKLVREGAPRLQLPCPSPNHCLVLATGIFSGDGVGRLPGHSSSQPRGTSLRMRSTHEESNMLSGVKIHLSRQLRKVLGLSQKAQP